MKQEDTDEQLSGGNSAAAVVRIGATVRKPVTTSTANVEAFLEHLSRSGFLHSPKPLGRDEEGRYSLEFIEGETIREPKLLTLDDLEQIGSILRQLHSVSATFPIPRAGQWDVAIQPDVEEIVCHNDLGPWNLVRNGSRWVFIDWDGSGPASRLWDLAYAAQSFVPLARGGNPEEDAPRLRAFVDGYGLDEHERKRLPSMLCRRTKAMYDLLERGARERIEPWQKTFMQDGGEYWRGAARYVQEHQGVWSAALSIQSKT